MKVKPMTLRAAREYVNANHRHHRAPQGGLFAVACEVDARITELEKALRELTYHNSFGQIMTIKCDATRIMRDLGLAD